MSSSLKVLQQGQDLFLIQAERASDVLPVGNYDLSFNDMKGYYLTKKSDFTLPEKIYGDPHTFSNRVLNTFDKLSQKNRGMGVLLSGKKGTGKSITAKVIAATSNRPVISISVAYTGQGLTNFLNSINTSVVFLIDEFEKTYNDEDSRNYLLSLLDGMASSAHLFVLTSNNSNIGEFFNSRPGRIRYHKQYDTLDSSIIESIIDDKVSDAKLNAAIKETARAFFDLSPDSLICLIEECLLYNEVPDQFLSFFNVRNEENTRFEATLIRNEWKFVKMSKQDNLKFRTNEDLYYQVDAAIDRLCDEKIDNIKDAELIVGTDLIKYIRYVECAYDTFYSDPFKIRDRIVINYMGERGGDGYTTININWCKSDCVITRNGNDMLIEHNDEGTLTLSVASVKQHNAF
jgi:hypothetical protein